MAGERAPIDDVADELAAALRDAGHDPGSPRWAHLRRDPDRLAAARLEAKREWAHLRHRGAS